jgi:hypothetical protein
MSTASFLILGALTKLGKNSPLKKAKADDISKGLSALQSLLQQFRTMGIILSTSPVESPNDEVGESLDTRNAIQNILAVEIATNYDNGQTIVSQSLSTNAESGMAFLRKWYKTDDLPLRRISSTAPRGAGNRKFIRNGRQRFGRFRILRDPEAITECD